MIVYRFRATCEVVWKYPDLRIRGLVYDTLSLMYASSFSEPKCVVLLINPFKVDGMKKCGDDINVIWRGLHQVITYYRLALEISLVSGKF